MRQLHGAQPPAGRVLEVGSGTGRDADFLETLGLRVLRTDAALAFIRMQGQRGRPATRLDIVEDALGGPWHGVLAKVARALHPGGVFLMSVRATLQPGDGPHISHWTRSDFSDALARK